MFNSKHVYIVGQNGLQNDLVAEHVARHTGLTCRILDDFQQLKSIPSPQSQNHSLAFCDCHGLNRDALKVYITQVPAEVYSTCLVALFNLASTGQIEDFALEYGVRGFFYEVDSAASLLKGVEVLFSGDYWVSRQKIIECLALGKNKTQNAQPKLAVEKILTEREIEILSLVALGGGNDKIADTLFISPHTVRTHLYNIFKKINVPNRLQASLWAAKHF